MKVANRPYYVKMGLAKQFVGLRVDAARGQFVVEADGCAVQRLAITGLGIGRLPFASFVKLGCAEARTLRSAAYQQTVPHHLR